MTTLYHSTLHHLYFIPLPNKPNQEGPWELTCLIPGIYTHVSLRVWKWVGNLRSFYTVYALYVTVIESVDFQIFLDNKNNIFVMKLELKTVPIQLSGAFGRRWLSCRVRQTRGVKTFKVEPILTHQETATGRWEMLQSLNYLTTTVHSVLLTHHTPSNAGWGAWVSSFQIFNSNFMTNMLFLLSKNIRKSTDSITVT